MATVTDTDLQELKDLINSRFEQLDRKIDSKIDAVDKKLDIYIAKTEERLKGIERRLEVMESSVNKIPDLAERMGELKNWRQIALIVITGTFGSIFGWFLRSGKF